jgi:pimeloyl-ACP methyl ester carboxylesterase
MPAMKADTTITAHESAQLERANTSGLTPVVFVHGLWLLPSSWDRWATLFEQAGYVALTPEWPDDAGTVAEANAHPEVFARKSIGQIAEHFAEVIGGLAGKPAPFRGVLPLPISALRSVKPVIISGEKDHTVPWAIANASYKQQEHNRGVTEITEIPNRGHALTIDSGWREAADTALAFAQRFARTHPPRQRPPTADA